MYDSRTTFTIDHAVLNKTEIDILHFIDSWLPTITDWSVEELAYKNRLFAADTIAAVDMLILHGLLVNSEPCDVTGRRVTVPPGAAAWIVENRETINGLQFMNDTEMYEPTEIAEA